ncbi:MAG: transglycosylase SLT domain-containing protein [Bacteroidetes bacterium]|nr:transglycosylase SLT domain-containing protein [Bacteroidota bacterium]
MKKNNTIFLFFTKALLILILQGICFFATAQKDVSNVAVIEKYVVSYNDVTKMKFINDEVLYSEGWHMLPQPKFWQQIMLLPPDSAIVSIAASRLVLDKINLTEWNKLSDAQHTLYRDSIRRCNNVPDSVSVLITVGKKDFYEYKKVMPTINRSIDVFKQNNVDPWYAQAILLIESPGKTNAKSGVGANGPFQLMKAVARKQGLIVNSSIDERTNVEKSAMGASRLLSRICIPYVRTMLDNAHLTYNETDLWFRLLVLHAYHAGAGNLAGVIRKIDPCEGGMQLIQQVWKTTYNGFKNASQNYSQLALAAFCNFDQLVMQQKDSVYLISGDRMLNAYVACRCAPYDACSYLSNCISKYENDLVEGIIPFDYFITKVKTVETELSGLTPFKYPYSNEHFNDIGFQLLKARKTEEAFKLFKLNESSYPDSWSVYHGLGETYRLMGQKKLALTNYKKSLLLKPNNEQSQRGIARLSGK